MRTAILHAAETFMARAPRALLGGIPTCFVDAHRPRAVRFTCSPASQGQGERKWPPPTQVHGGRGGPMSMKERELVSIRINPNEQGHPPGKTCRRGGDLRSRCRPTEWAEVERLRGVGTT